LNRGGNRGWPTLCGVGKGGPLFALVSYFHPSVERRQRRREIPHSADFVRNDGRWGWRGGRFNHLRFATIPPLRAAKKHGTPVGMTVWAMPQKARHSGRDDTVLYELARWGRAVFDPYKCQPKSSVGSDCATEFAEKRTQDPGTHSVPGAPSAPPDAEEG